MLTQRMPASAESLLWGAEDFLVNRASSVGAEDFLVNGASSVGGA